MSYPDPTDVLARTQRLLMNANARIKELTIERDRLQARLDSPPHLLPRGYGGVDMQGVLNTLLEKELPPVPEETSPSAEDVPSTQVEAKLKVKKNKKQDLDGPA